MLAHGQFGNWCIQHICEHGAPHDRSRAIEHILLRAVDFSVDQFASKIVEKCLKIGGSEFLDRYLTRVSTGRADRPRMPLIDSKLILSFFIASGGKILIVLQLLVTNTVTILSNGS